MHVHRQEMEGTKQYLIQMPSIQRKHVARPNGLPAPGRETLMPESHADKGRRKLLQIDCGLYNALAYTYEYYYLLLRADIGLASAVELIMLQIDDTRRQLRDLYAACWEADHETFSTIGDVPQLIAEARRDVLGRSTLCRAYLNVLDHSALISSRLLEKRAEAYSRQSASPDP